MTKRCFVVQGFGLKQDYEQGKQFDLDASYAVIKEAIEAAGIACHRGDELRTSGMIDQVMYDELLSADLVVADITTLNFNAAYELGVRLALRPHSTLIVGDQKINFPFDVNHIYIHTYKHLGEDIGRREAIRFSSELTKLAKQIIDTSKNDSPVYKFLSALPPDGFLQYAQPPEPMVQPKGSVGKSLRDLKEEAAEAMKASRFEKAVTLWTEARKLAGKDDYIVQQLVLATYKSKAPNAEQALREALGIIQYLQPHTSFDTETLGLWASIHKRLYELDKEPASLDEAIFALEKGFFIKNDYYNGINLAFMLDTKASVSDGDIKQELHSVARYIRRKVKRICKSRLGDPELADGGEKYWILATLYEACIGLGQQEEALRWKESSKKAAEAAWMSETTENQLAKLRDLLPNNV